MKEWLAHPWAGAILRGTLALLATLLALWLGARVRRVLDWLSSRVERRIETRTRRLGLQGIDGISQHAVATTVETISVLVRIVLLAVLFYAWLVFLAYVLDASHRYVWLVLDPLQHSAESAAAAVSGFLPNIVILVLIIAVGRVLQSVIRAFTTGIALGHVTSLGLDSAVATPTHRILSFVLWVAMVILAAPYLPGSDSKAFQAVSVMLGILVSLGSSSFVSNLIAGLTLTYSRAYRVGDRVKIGEHYGDVTALGAITTRIRTIKDEELILPNGFAHGNPVINYSRYAATTGVQASAQVTVGYDVPPAVIEALLIRAALATPGIAAEPLPYVLAPALEDHYARYELCAFTRIPNELHLIETRMRRKIHDTFSAAGVEMCSPSYLAVRDGNAPAISRQGIAQAQETLEGERALDLQEALDRGFRVRTTPHTPG